MLHDKGNPIPRSGHHRACVVAMKVLVEPRAPGTPSRLSQKPARSRDPMMMRTFFLLCARPGLFLGNDDSELFQRERRVLARPVRTNQHRLARLRHHQGASTRPLLVDTGERPLCAPVHTLANGGQHSRLLVARYTMITLTAEYDAGI